MTLITDDINHDILLFAERSGLGDHRVGTLLAGNGMLVPRAREGGRHFPVTVAKIQKNLKTQIDRRQLDPEGFRCLLAA